jgi:UDP-glucuronate 4-epimerase
MAVFRFARAARTPGATLTMFGDGERTWRDYAHVADVVDGLLAALFREPHSTPSEKTTPSNAAIGPAGEADRADHDVLTVNIASGSATRLRELVDVVVGVAAASNEDPPARRRERARPGDVGGTYAAVDEAERALGWRPKIGLREGIAMTEAWYRTEGAAPWRDPPEGYR